MHFVQFLCSRFCSLLHWSGNQQSLKLWSTSIFLVLCSCFPGHILHWLERSQAAIPIYSAWLADVQSTQSNQDHWEWMSKSVWMQHSATARNPKTKENINYRRKQAHASSPLQDAQKKGRAQQFESQNQIHGTWIWRDFTVRNAAFRISTHLKSTLLVIGWSVICLPRLNEMKQLSAAFLFLDTWVLHPHGWIDTNFPCFQVLWPKAVATLLALSCSTCDVFYPKWEAWGTDQL